MTDGGELCEYPLPPLTTVKPEIAPLDMAAVILADELYSFPPKITNDLSNSIKFPPAENLLRFLE